MGRVLWEAWLAASRSLHICCHCRSKAETSIATSLKKSVLPTVPLEAREAIDDRILPRPGPGPCARRRAAGPSSSEHPSSEGLRKSSIEVMGFDLQETHQALQSVLW